MSEAKTCVVADDHPSVLHTLAQVLHAWGWTVAASTREGGEAIRKIEELRPAVALLDLKMRGASGIEVALRTRRSTPETAVLVYTASDDAATVREAFDAGALGYVVKEASLDELRRALEAVARGERYVDPLVAGVLIATNGRVELTQREREVLRLLAEGSSYEEMASALFISTGTARAHVAKALRKLGARTRTEAVAKALRSGLIA